MPDLHNIQGLIAQRYDQPRAFIFLFRIEHAEKARSFVERWLPNTPRGDQPPPSLRGPLVNFSFTWPGLCLLLAGKPGLDEGSGRKELDWAFTDQAPDHPGVSRQLGFINESAPSNWWDKRFANIDVHMAVHAFFDDAGQAETATAEIRASASASGLVELRLGSFTEGALNGCRPEGGILHFGLRDGITSHDVDWSDQANAPGKIDCREFLIGYPNDIYPVPPQKPGAWRDFMRDGSFACVAWIDQDVAGFNRFLDEHEQAAAQYVGTDLARDWLTAKLLGRWPNGSPLARHPTSSPSAPDLADDFGYTDDPHGVKCPLWAHIRIVNPRDQVLTYPNQVRFPMGPPRLIRRGITYGPPFAGYTDDDVRRGVIGTFFCARINEQFYTILRWMQKTEFSGRFFDEPYSGTMQDALFGNRNVPRATTSVTIPLEDGKFFPLRLRDFITYRGVSVFFTPSLAALGLLGTGPAATGEPPR